MSLWSQGEIGHRVEMSSIEVNGRPIDPKACYNVVTKAYLASGKDGYNVFSQCRMVSDAEGTPLLADLVRSQFSHLHEINEKGHLPDHAPHSEEKQGRSAKRMTHTDLLRRSIHLGLEEHNMSNPPTPPSGTPTSEGAPATPPAKHAGAPSLVSTLVSTSSTEDLEALLVNKAHGKANWEFGAKGEATSCHPFKIGGRYQIFGKTDGRIKCIHATARKSFDGIGMP